MFNANFRTLAELCSSGKSGSFFYYIHKTSCNLTEFDKVFKQLKFDHTIIGLHISNSDVNSGTQTGLKI